MKTSLTLLSLIFSFTAVLGQHLEMTFQHHLTSYLNRIHITPENNFLVGGLHQPSILQFDATGKLIWQNSFPCHLPLDFETSGDSTMVSCSENSYDLIQNNSIILFDKSGQSVGFRSLSRDFQPHCPLRCGMEDGYCTLFNAAKNFLELNFGDDFSIPFDFFGNADGDIKDFLMENRQTVFVLQGTKIKYANLENQEILTERELPAQGLRIKNFKDEILILTKNQLIKSDYQFNFSDTFGFAQSSRFFEIDTDGNRIVLLGQNDLNEHQILVLKNDLSFENQFEILSDNFIPRDLGLLNDEVLVAGAASYMPPVILFDDWFALANYAGESYGFLKSYALDGQTTPVTSDVAITGVNTAGRITFTPFNSICTDRNYAKATLRDVPITIKNAGADTLKSFNLSVFANEGCNQTLFSVNLRRHFQSFEKLSIPPNGEVEMILPMMEFSGVFADQPLQLCFRASVPNFKIDADHSNDLHCAIFENIVQTAEALPPAFFVSISPNPVQDFFQLSINATRAEKLLLTISDIFGREVFRKDFFAQTGTTQLPVSLPDALAPGHYFVRLTNATGSYFDHLPIIKSP